MTTLATPPTRPTTDVTTPADRGLLAATGAAFAILVVIGNGIYSEGGNQTVSYSIELLGYVSLAIFLAWITSALGPARGAPLPLAVIGGTAMLTVKLAGWAAVMASQNTSLEPDVAAGLVQFDEQVFVLAWLPWGLFLTGLALAARLARRLPRWMAWVGVAIGVSCMAAVPASSAEPFVFPWLISLLWLIATSTLLVRGQWRLAQDQRRGEQPWSVEV